MDTDCYLAMEFLKMRVTASCSLALGPGAEQAVFESKDFEEMERKAWKDAEKFRALRNSKKVWVTPSIKTS